MRFTIALLVVLLPGLAAAAGLANSKGALVIEFDGEACVPDNTKSVVFGSGAFPFTQYNSRVESAHDVSDSNGEIRLRLHGWVKEMTDYRDAFLSIRGSSDQLDKFRSDPNIGTRYLRVTTDPRCASTAALVDVVQYFYDWKPVTTAGESNLKSPL
jgi:hypothetical protein